MVHRTWWETLLEAIRATQSLSWRAQILETRPATAHPQWRIIQPSQVYCEKGNAIDESTPRRNTKGLCEVFVKLLARVLYYVPCLCLFGVCCRVTAGYNQFLSINFYETRPLPK